MRAEVLNRVLVHVQANLEEDLALGSLARLAGLSPFHFERQFSRLVGETVKQYTQRLRLERAAIRLLLHRSRVLDIALDCGFQGPETFTRAFRRRYGLSPRGYRQRGFPRPPRPAPPPRTARPLDGAVTELSSTTLQSLEDLHLAFIRHTGPYEQVSETLWANLTTWARRHRIPEPFILLGIGHDAPGITAPDKLRFDAALRVPGPLRTTGRIGYQLLTGRTFAVTTHVGPYDLLPAAYHELVYGASRLPVGKRRTALEEYLHGVVRRSFPVLPYDDTAAEWHGKERARLEESGPTPPFVDGQIAAIACTMGLTLVTSNTRDFAWFSDLKIADWSR